MSLRYSTRCSDRPPTRRELSDATCFVYLPSDCNETKLFDTHTLALNLGHDANNKHLRPLYALELLNLFYIVLSVRIILLYDRW